ncbi:MAG: peptidylprolyl isomerase [Gammaproteobacteria bacterium]
MKPLSRNSLPVFLISLMLTLSGQPAGAAPKPQVRLSTTLGDIVVELDMERAPQTVNNFLTYLQYGSYNGTIFHRVIPGFVIQGGGFTPDFRRVPTQAPVHNESRGGLSNRTGTIAMARTRDPHSATSQFYINLRDNTSLDYGGGADPSGWGYTVFGRVIEGMDVVQRIAAVPTGSGGPFRRDVPREAVVLKEATLLDNKAAQ